MSPGPGTTSRIGGRTGGVGGQLQVGGGAAQCGAQDLLGLDPKLRERPVSVGPAAELDLRDRIDAAAGRDVDQQPHLHAVVHLERDGTRDVSADRILAPSGWLTWLRCGNSSDSAGRAVSSVTLPPSPGRPSRTRS